MPIEPLPEAPGRRARGRAAVQELAWVEAFEELGAVSTTPPEHHHLVAAEFGGVVLLVFWFEDGYTTTGWR
jgi:hypothetical protein